MTQPVLNDESAPPENMVPRGAMPTLFLIALSDMLGFGLIIPLLPFYALKFKASAFEVTILFSLFSACQFIASPILGHISDRHGRRAVLMFSQMGSVLGYVMLGLVTQAQWDNVALGLWLIYATRIIDGLSGGNISTAQAYIADITTRQHRARGMGLLGAAFGIGFAFGPALGGMLGHEPHMGYPAYCAALASGAALLLTWLWLPETRRHIPAESELWLHPKNFAPVFRHSTLLQLMCIWFLSMSAFVVMDSCVALYLSQHFNWSPRQVGMLFFMIGVIIIIVQGGLIGKITRRFGEWRPMIIGMALVATGFVVFTESYYLPALGLLCILLGHICNAVGRSFQQPAISALVSKISSPEDQGLTFGFFQGVGSLARVFGPVLAGLIYTHHVTATFYTGAAMVGLAAIWSACLWVWRGQAA